MLARHLSPLFLSLAFSASTLAQAYQLPNNKPKTQASPALQLLQKVSQGVAELTTKTRPGIVFVSVAKAFRENPMQEINPFDYFFNPRNEPTSPMPERRQTGLGSGYLVDIKQGYVITNNHVVEGADDIQLKLGNGKTYAGQVLGRDPGTDIAVIQIKDRNFDRQNLSELSLGNSDEVKDGDMVLALGAPFGLEASVSFGVVSASSRGNLDIIQLGNFIQTDAAINPGNSGGPLLNMNGQVIGMNSAIFSRSGTSAGIGFAIPANLVRLIANELINKGKVVRGYLGVRLDQDLSEDIIAGLNLPRDTQGALISVVRADSPAAKAGIVAGDIIVAINDKKITNRSDVTYQVGTATPRTKVSFTVLRQGKPLKMDVTLEALPDPKEEVGTSANKNIAANAPSGLKLESVTSSSATIKNLRKNYGVQAKTGLLISGIVPFSEAEQAGLKVGDVLLEVNNKPLKTVDDFAKAYKAQTRLLIKIERSQKTLFATMRR